jgi:hypothetical protein
MMGDYENVLVAIVGRDGKATGEVGGRPLVSEERERLRRVAGRGETRRAEARETREAEEESERTGREDEPKATAAGESFGRVEATPRLRVLR